LFTRKRRFDERSYQGQTRRVVSKIETDDLIDDVGVAEILCLASRRSVRPFQERHTDMPRPVVDLGEGRTQLWSRRAMLAYATVTGRVRTK
jgi:hypothetical protein